MKMAVCKYNCFYLNRSYDAGLASSTIFCDVGQIALHPLAILATIGSIRIVRILKTVSHYLFLVSKNCLSVLYDILFIILTLKKIVLWRGCRKNRKQLHYEVANYGKIALKRLGV
jgi:hypothetical protein